MEACRKKVKEVHVPSSSKVTERHSCSNENGAVAVTVSCAFAACPK